jgi:aryl-alcohol dehydrogenase-like predicted oxidoreductase
LEGSLKRLNLESVDLYQVHWPFPPISAETWADALADVVDAGLTRAVGVSNFDTDQMLRAHEVLTKRGVPLASNQVEYNLIKRDVEFNGLLNTCQELGITLISYSPLSQGVLTGKYSPDQPLPGIRGRRYNRNLLKRVQPLLREMRKIGRAHGDKTESQVALNWLMCKGTVPIPGAKNARQAQENCGALGMYLSEDEMSALDQASGKIS